ncbi:hypothetical protein JQN72_09010 [Phycicoccus sp. CSK15P-2]|nr:hypothetical protein [Phycicoccus sp. CSK15P-2]
MCALQSLVLVGVVGFYGYELAVGEGSDPVRVVMSGLLILLGAAGLAVLARGWWGRERWPRTPTVVWNALLVPVGWSLVQAGRTALGAGVLFVALLTGGAAVAARVPDPDGLGDA